MKYFILLLGICLATGVWGQTSAEMTNVVKDGEVEQQESSALPSDNKVDTEIKHQQIPLAESVNEIISMIKSYGPVDEQVLRQGVLEAIVSHVDPLGRVISAEEYEQIDSSHQGEVSAVGIDVNWSTNQELTVVSVVEGTFAQEKGMAEGDIIEVIEDRAATNMTMQEVKQMLRGPTNQTVHLKIRKPDDTTEEYDMERDIIPMDGIDWTEQFPEGVAYMRVNGIFEGTGSELVEQLLDWETNEVFGVILDLRDACGKDMQSIHDIGSLFAQAGDMLYVIRDKDDQDIEVSNAVADGSLFMPVMVLLNTNTCGAAEVLAGVLKGSTRGALLIGKTSPGDFIIREPLELSTGEYIFIATRKMVVADGTIYDGKKGVVPDIQMSSLSVYGKDYEPSGLKETLDEEKEDKWLRQRVQGDPILHRAVNLILGLKALDLRTGENEPSDH